MKSSLRLGLLASAGLICLGVSQAAAAEEAPNGDPEIIIVTAEKRSANVKDVPSSISVVTGETIEKLGITNLADYAAYVPGLNVNSAGSPGHTIITLRGISTGTGGGSLVGTYVDDTPLGSSSGFARAREYALDLMPYDIERIEVLRGPQGTLYGAGTMGGLLKYVLSKADTDKAEVRAGGLVESTASAGEPTWGVRGLVNVPLVEGKLAVRVSGFYQKTAGYIDNVGLGIRNENRFEQKGGRAALTWTPTDTLEINASAILQDSKADGPTLVRVDPATMDPVYGRYSRFSFLPETFNTKLRYYSLTADLDLGFASLTSATSWSRNHVRDITDQTESFGAFVPLIDPTVTDGRVSFPLDITLHKYTQEVRLTSADSDKFTWMVGGFYTDEDVLNLQRLDSFDEDLNPVSLNYPLFTAFWPSSYKEWAVFGNATYHFTDRFDITLGGRYARNKQDYFQDLTGAAAGAGPGQTLHVEAQSKDNNFTWLVSPRFHLSEDMMLYGRVATGYRPGGPNVALPGVPPSYKADTLINYEAGIKGVAFDGAFDFNFAFFYIDWKDIQITQFADTNGDGDPDDVTYPGNGEGASSRGFEFDATIRPLPGLRLLPSISYSKAKLDDDAPAIGGVKGDRLPLAARWTASLGLAYETPVSANVGLSLSADYLYRGNQLDEIRGLTVPAQNIVNARAGFSIGERFDISLYVRNLFNDRSYSTLVSKANPASANFAPVQPRTAGVSFDARF